LISSVTTAPLRPLLPPRPPERRIRRRSFVNDLLLGEKTHPVILSDRNAAELHPPASAEFDGTGENAANGAGIAANHRRLEDVDVDEGNHGTDDKPSDVVEIDPNRSGNRKQAKCQPVRTMLLVVTADMVAATAQIPDDDRDCAVESSTPPPCGISSCSDVAAGVESTIVSESLDDATSSTTTDDLLTTVATARQP